MIRSKVTIGIICLALIGCASVKVLPATPRLSDLEREIVAALLYQEARHPQRPRPILIFDQTETWMPRDEPAPDRPAGVSEDEWAELWRPLPVSLRQVNRLPYRLDGLPLPPGATLYPKARFEREYHSDRDWPRLVKRLGGVEPLVLSVSRPFVADDGQSAVVLLHVNSTWSSDGGVNQFTATRTGGTWRVDLDKVLVIW